MAIKTDVNSKDFWNAYLRAAQIDAGETLGYKRNDKNSKLFNKQTSSFLT